MNIYGAILEEANGSSLQAGHLHEELWNRLLRLEDARHHNVRVTNGDHGIDGLVLTDPVLGHVSIYQAKFFRDLAEGPHREAVRKSLAKAAQFAATVTRWTLLLPFMPSAAEVAWIVSDLRREVASSWTQSTALANLSIDYRTGEYLNDLCLRHLPDAAAMLPRSVLALSSRLADADERNRLIEREMVDRLRALNDHSIRAHQVQSQRALGALKILNQGWADHTVALGLLRRVPGTTPEEVETFAAQLEAFALARTQHALDADPIAAGAGDLGSRIYILSRHLRASAVQAQVAQGDTGAQERMRSQMNELQESCQQLQTLVGIRLFEFSQNGS